ncbi:unnamed protein product [Caenorhabditis nigoni]
MGKFFVFLLFWTSCLTQETWHKFRIGGQLICDYDKNFIYSVELHDGLARIGKPDTDHNRGSVNFSVFGIDTNWGTSNLHYEPYMKILHSCNLDNVVQRLKYPMGDIFIPQGEVISLNYVINITDAGTEGIGKLRKLSESADFSEFNDEESDRDIPLK